MQNTWLSSALLLVEALEAAAAAWRRCISDVAVDARDKECGPCTKAVHKGGGLLRTETKLLLPLSKRGDDIRPVVHSSLTRSLVMNKKRKRCERRRRKAWA